jgi:hypothetical protein
VLCQTSKDFEGSFCENNGYTEKSRHVGGGRWRCVMSIECQ